MKTVLKQKGFTIVELLIVVVVIGVLAAITIVAYNGVQTRSKNAKTVTSLSAWAKAINLYYVDLGSWPNSTTCLGNTTTYDDDGRCWSASAWVVQPSFIDSLKPYLGQVVPEPDTTKVFYDSTNTIRGARYHYGSGTPQIYYVLAGVSTCPAIGGLNANYQAVYSGGVQCGGIVTGG